MTKKILYAVQAKAIEDRVTADLREQTGGSIVNVGTAGYREQVLPSLKQSGADILLYREDLKGSMDLFELMRTIREEYPNVRIIFIAHRQETTSRLLCSLVFLGIYDIINENAVAPAKIIDHILNPHNFGDVAKYFHPQYMDSYMPEESAVLQAGSQPSGGKGFLSGLIKGIGEITKGGSVVQTSNPATGQVIQSQQEQQPVVVAPRAPSVDIESMRSAMLDVNANLKL